MPGVVLRDRGHADAGLGEGIVDVVLVIRFVVHGVGLRVACVPVFTQWGDEGQHQRLQCRRRWWCDSYAPFLALSRAFAAIADSLPVSL